MSNINFRSGNPRKLFYYGIICTAMLLLLGGFYNLQILQESVYRGQSEKNSIKRETRIPVRGHIYDRNWGRFQLTGTGVDSLRQVGVPFQLLRKLMPLKSRVFDSEAAFLDSLSNRGGKAEINRYKNAFLRYCQMGKLIVDNRPSFALYLVPALTTRAQLDSLSSIINIPVDQMRRKFRRSRRFQPVKIARYVDYRTLVKLQENRLDFPGLEWKVEPKRHYYFKSSYAHVLGTLGEIGEDELGRDDSYEPGDIVGKKGIEKVLDKELRGEKGYRFVKMDAVGRRVEEIAFPENAFPYPGKDLYLTIDARLQRYADSLFADRNGAFVAVDVRNGEILTLLSKPDYDLNLFAEAVDSEVWKSLMSDSLKPLFDRVTQATYPPGSTYKMVAAIAGLNEGIVSPSWSVFCPGYFRIGRRTIRCWNAGGHGEVDAVSAIRGSCNVYFYKLGLKIGIDQWADYSNRFLFGKLTEVELTAEKSGLVPSKKYYDRIYGKNGWTKGILANIAIGQGELLVTPLQMAQFAMILANNGTNHQLHLRRKLVDKIPRYRLTDKSFQQMAEENISPEILSALSPLKDQEYSHKSLIKNLDSHIGLVESNELRPQILGSAEKRFAKPDTFATQSTEITGISPEVFEIVREGMRQVVAGGTGWRAGVWRKSGGGKTGTAQNPHGDTHAWYIGFAPFENPEIAIAVIFENGGGGGAVAAPVVGKYLQRYFHYKGEFNYQEYREFQRILYEKQKEQALQDSIQAAQAVADSLQNLAPNNQD